MTEECALVSALEKEGGELAQALAKSWLLMHFRTSLPLSVNEAVPHPETSSRSAGCMVMASSDSASANSSLAAVSVSSATGALLLAEAARGASVSAWAPPCVPPRIEQLTCEVLTGVNMMRECD